MASPSRLPIFRLTRESLPDVFVKHQSNAFLTGSFNSLIRAMASTHQPGSSTVKRQQLHAEFYRRMSQAFFPGFAYEGVVVPGHCSRFSFVFHLFELFFVSSGFVYDPEKKEEEKGLRKSPTLTDTPSHATMTCY